MTGFRPWDLVKVPLPYTDRPVRQYRPALVVAAGEIETADGLIWVLMITSAANRRWANDVAITNLTMAGLPVASVIRCAKIAAIEARDAERIGGLSHADQNRAVKQLAHILVLMAGHET